jgi:hypothetical protein
MAPMRTANNIPPPITFLLRNTSKQQATSNNQQPTTKKQPTKPSTTPKSKNEVRLFFHLYVVVILSFINKSAHIKNLL